MTFKRWKHNNISSQKIRSRFCSIAVVAWQVLRIHWAHHSSILFFFFSGDQMVKCWCCQKRRMQSGKVVEWTAVVQLLVRSMPRNVHCAQWPINRYSDTLTLSYKYLSNTVHYHSDQSVSTQSFKWVEKELLKVRTQKKKENVASRVLLIVPQVATRHKKEMSADRKAISEVRQLVNVYYLSIRRRRHQFNRNIY